MPCLTESTPTPPHSTVNVAPVVSSNGGDGGEMDHQYQRWAQAKGGPSSGAPSGLATPNRIKGPSFTRHQRSSSMSDGKRERMIEGGIRRDKGWLKEEFQTHKKVEEDKG